MRFDEWSIADLGRELKAGRISSEAVTREALERIGRADGAVHAFVATEAASAVAAARIADAELRQGHVRGPMHGIPYAIKDIYDVAGLPTRCGSRLRDGHVATSDSTVAARFREAGAILLGKLSTYEFAIGGPSFDLPLPPTRNPWNLDHVPGGSSSGSAAAIAAGFVRLAIGSCTAGSIRGPAAWSGTVGLKPSYGRVSRHGVFPLAWSLDHCGPLARSVEDAAIALQIMAGHDPRDPASVDMPVPDFLHGLHDGVSGMRFAVPRAFFASHAALTQDTRCGIERTLDLLRESGAAIEDVDLPDYSLFLACNRVIMASESYALHKADLQRRVDDYGEISVKRIVAGVGIDASDYIAALRLRRQLTDAINVLLMRYDGLITAISLAPAPRFEAAHQPLAWPLQASPFNVTGHPAMSVPIGLDRQGLPLAVQVIGRPFDEATVLRLGRAIETLTGWDKVPLPILPQEPADRG